MTKKTPTRQLVLTGLFIAIGLILPMVFHAVGAGSTIFLPMHIPVLIAGFYLNPPYALAVGVMTPVLSSLLTGMPPLFPTLPFMMFELATYGMIVSLLYIKYHKQIVTCLIAAMISGRIVAGFVVWILTTCFVVQLPNSVVFIKGAVVTGMPGIVIQLIFIPMVVMGINKYKISTQTYGGR